MKSVRKAPATALNLPTLRLEGGLFLPDVLAKAAHGQARLQTEADYACPKGLKLKDEYSRAFQIATAQWHSFAALLERADFNPQHATNTFVAELLRDALAYPQVVATTALAVGEGASQRLYPITHLASTHAGANAAAIPVVVAPHTLGLDDADPRFAVLHADGSASGGRKKSAFQLAQELLNASPHHQWAMVSNGKTLRLLRDAATLTRPSYLEFDLADLLGGQRFAEWACTWRLLHASRAGLLSHTSIATVAAEQTQPPVAWEAWREAGQEEGTRVRNGLRLGVTSALITLGQGFVQHPANQPLRQALQDGALSQQAYFAQLLRLIYRFIFVFSVEERGLVPNQPQPGDDPATVASKQAAATAYAQGYALARLRPLALRRRLRTAHADQWQALQIVFKGLAQGQPALGLPALGGLFAPGQCPHLDAAQLSNAHLLAAMQSLRWAPAPGGPLAPIDYRNMGTEELGSVYESLLELVPQVDVHARQFGFVGMSIEGGVVGTVAGNDRKLTGSYYTPDSLVQELIRSALDPVIEQRLAAQPAAPIEALLAIRVIDPACGSGHFLLAAARRLAEKLATLRAPDGAVTPTAYRHALREVVAQCIFGVDRNPMAVELARTALWLEGFEEGRPLGFLDHHLQCGDALLGLINLQALELGIPKDAFKPLSGDDKDVCKQLAKTNAAGQKQLAKDLNSGQQLLAFATDAGLQALRNIEAQTADTPEQVAAKAHAYRQFCEHSAQSPLALAANLVISAYLLPKTPDNAALVPTSATLHTALTQPAALAQPGTELAAQVAAAQAACHTAQVLHWPLAFPQVFAQGGFDCVLGNPPWERIKLQEEEFFATRHPAVAQAQNKAERARFIAWLCEGTLAQHLNPHLGAEGVGTESAAEQRLHTEFISARRTAEAASVFMHVGGDEGGRYPLTGVGDVNTYALFAETMLHIAAPTGRAGFIVPTGIATDDSTKAYFGHISQTGRLVSLYDIENRDAVFPSVHRSFKFCLLTLGQAETAEFVCFAAQVPQLADARRRFALTPNEFRLINPNTLTCPVFRSACDAALTKKLYRAAPILIREAVWAGEGKQAKLVSPEVNPWGISFMRMLDMSNDSGLFQNNPAPSRLPLYEAKLIHQFDHRWATYTPDGDSRDLTLAEKQDPATTATPRYWVEAREVWLRVSTLPDGLLKALRQRNPDAIVLCVTQLLFAWWLADQRQGAPSLGVYPAWLEFIEQHPYAADVAPTSLGLCGGNPTCATPLDDNHLPAEGEVQVFMSTERVSTAWFAVDPDALAAVLRFTSSHRHLPPPTQPLVTADDVLALAEHWLQTSCPQWLMGWRNIARATDERSFISSVMPLYGVGHSMPLWSTVSSMALSAVLLANTSTLVVDYLVRQKLGGTNMTFGYVKQFPILPPDRYTDVDLAFIVPRVLELTYTADDLSGWAQALGHSGPPFPFHPERRATLRAELDAHYARLYGLTRDEVRYILDPADVMGLDYPSETFRVLKNKELKEFGEYRTQRLVLREFDRMSLADATGMPYISLLTPLPGQHAQSTYSSHGVIQDEADTRLLGVLLTMIGRDGRLLRRRLTDAMTLAAQPSLWPSLLDATGMDVLTAYVQVHPGVLDAQRLAGDRIQNWLRHLEAIGLVRMEAQTNMLLAIVGAVMPSHVVLDEDTVRVAAVLTHAATRFANNTAHQDQQSDDVVVKRA